MRWPTRKTPVRPMGEAGMAAYAHPVTLDEIRLELVRFAQGELRTVLQETLLSTPTPIEQLPSREPVHRHALLPTESPEGIRLLTREPSGLDDMAITPKLRQPFVRQSSCLPPPAQNADMTPDKKREHVEIMAEIVESDDEVACERPANVGFRRQDWFESSYPTRIAGPHGQSEEDEDGEHQQPLLRAKKKLSQSSGISFFGTNHSDMMKSVPQLAHAEALVFEDDVQDTEFIYSHIHQHKALLANAKSYKQATGAAKIIANKYFELLMATLVVLSAGLVGFEADRALLVEANNHAEGCQALQTCYADVFCASAFTAELLLRLFALGSNFFSVPSWRWNVFDSVVLFLQWMYLAVVAFPSLQLPVETSIIRTLRFVRIARIFRIVRFLSELQLIVKSITATVTGVIWALVLLMVIVYVCSVLFLQTVSIHHMAHMHPHIERWFGGLFRTMLTLVECIFGGVGWEQVVGPLVTDISPWLGVAFVLYVTIAIVALLNLVTGLFVEKVTQTVRDERDNDLAQSICELFIKDIEHDQELNWEEFAEKMKSQAMLDFFREIEVDFSDAMDFFQLMDTNKSGTVSAEEIVNGCLRLRGPAKSLDMAILVRAVDNIENKLSELMSSGGPAVGMRGSLDVRKNSAP